MAKKKAPKAKEAILEKAEEKEVVPTSRVIVQTGAVWRIREAVEFTPKSPREEMAIC